MPAPPGETPRSPRAPSPPRRTTTTTTLADQERERRRTQRAITAASSQTTPNGVTGSSPPEGLTLAADEDGSVAWTPGGQGPYEAAAIVTANGVPDGFQMWIELYDGVHSHGLTGPFSPKPGATNAKGVDSALVFAGVVGTGAVIYWTAPGATDPVTFDVQFLGTSLS